MITALARDVVPAERPDRMPKRPWYRGPWFQQIALALIGAVIIVYQDKMPAPYGLIAANAVALILGYCLAQACR